jgi:hypothetical protein
LFFIDSPYHWYNMKLAANLAATGNVVGYDPFFSAGHLNGVFYYHSGRLPALLAAVFSPPFDEIRLYKIYVFTTAVLAPSAITAAAVVWRLPVLEVLLATFLAIVMWWVSYFHWYFTAGMVAYVTMCYLCVLFVALLTRQLEVETSNRRLIGLGLFAALTFFIHPLFPVLAAAVTVTYLALKWQDLTVFRTLRTLSVVAILSLLLNLIWIYPTYRYFGGYFVEAQHQKLVSASLIWRELIGTLDGDAHGSKAYPLLLAASVWAFARPIRGTRAGGLALVFLVSALVIELLAYLGAASPAVAKLQPNRFAPAGYLFLCVPAACGLSAMARACGTHHRRVWRAFAALGVAAAVLVSAILTWEVWREVTPGPQGRYGASPPQVKPLGEYSKWIIQWLERRTAPDARVLFENSLGRMHDNAHMAGYYAYETQREFIGGPYPFMHFASFWDDWIFGKRLSQVDFKELADYVSLYNIGWIVVHSAGAKRYFDAMPGVRLDDEHGSVRAYVIDREHSYFLTGTGRVQKRQHNLLVLTDLSGPEVVLKYHFVPGMTSEPPAQIDGVQKLDDPTAFVRIKNPPSNLRLYFP